MFDLASWSVFLLIAASVMGAAQLFRRWGQLAASDRLLVPDWDAAAVPPGVDAFQHSLAALPLQVGFGYEGLDADLRRAGRYGPDQRDRFLALRNGLVVGLVLVAGIAAVAIGPGQNRALLIALASGGFAAGMAWGLPRVVLKLWGVRRVERLRRQVPDALDLTSMCLASGLSFQDALAHVGREVRFAHPELADELDIVARQAEMMSLAEAFRQFAVRTDAPEIVSLSGLVTQNERLGTNLSEAVREFAESMRLRRRQRADAQANKATLKMLFPLNLCLLPSFVLLLWGPAILELVRFFRDFDAPSDFGM